VAKLQKSDVSPITQDWLSQIGVVRRISTGAQAAAHHVHVPVVSHWIGRSLVGDRPR
jgi:hypothetical protein